MRSLIVALAALAAATALAAPAAAQDPVRTLDAFADGAQNDVNGQSYVVFNCSAVAKGAAVSVALTSCYLLGDNGVQYKPDPIVGAAPGPAATRTQAGTFPAQGYKACVTARATFFDASVLTTPLHCSQLYRAVQ